MAPSDPDLHRAISMKPIPFRAESPSRAGPSTPAPAKTSAYEPTNALKGNPDPVSRPAFARVDSLTDVENQRLPSYTPENDPYHLSALLKTPEQLSQIRPNSSRKRQIECSPLAQVQYTRRLRGFYEAQNENIERLLKPVADHRREAKEEAGADAFQYKVAVYASFAANLCLAVLQLYGAISSGSLSLFTTTADAVFDPLSNITLILCNRAVNRVDGRKYPSGKARIETAGNICFCFLMCSVSFILIVLSARDIAAGSDAETTPFHLASVVAVGTAFVVKFALFLYCWALRNKYSQIRILWEDHRNDLFINGYVITNSRLHYPHFNIPR